MFNVEIKFIQKRLTDASGVVRYLIEKCSLASVQLPAEYDAQTHWEMVARGPYNL